MMKKRIGWMVVISLLLAGGIHLARRLAPTEDKQKELASLKLLLPQAQSFSEKSGRPPCYEGYNINSRGEKELIGLCFLTTDIAPEVKGYAGPIKLMVGMDTKGTLSGIEIIGHHETPSYAWGIEEPWFKRQFKGKSAGDAFRVDEDIDGISRATVTVTAIALGVKKSAVRVGRERLGLDIPEAEENPWAQVDYLILALLAGLLALAVISLLLKTQKWRTVTLVTTIALVGIYHTNSLSSVNVVNIITYRLPALPQNLFWYLLMGFAILSCLVWGRVYCGFICPFGAVLELLKRIKEYRLKFSPHLQQRAKYIKYVILWLVVVASLLLNDANVSDYEPFSTMFTWIGDRLDWALLLLAAGGSLLIPRFFCRYLCGLGLSLGLLSKYSLRRLKIKPGCNHCQNCQAACPYGAIETLSDGSLDIDPVECIQCQICLDGCPHGNIGR
jgi:Na+-translocating ferredoxin:NAD+ oxidoreductase RnfG subunit/ferredoxin